jgi:hypothetical protein
MLKEIRTAKPRQTHRLVPKPVTPPKFTTEEVELPPLPPSRVMEILVEGEIRARDAERLLGARYAEKIRDTARNDVLKHAQTVFTVPNLSDSIYDALSSFGQGQKKEWKYWARILAQRFRDEQARRAQEVEDRQQEEAPADGIDPNERRIRTMEQRLRRAKGKGPRPRGLHFFLPEVPPEAK